jgi:hypothetical protein
MSSSFTPLTFMELYSEGAVTADEIDDFIDRWHEEAPAVTGRPVPIHEFLGMTWDEYEAWVRDPSVLPSILRTRTSDTSPER